MQPATLLLTDPQQATLPQSGSRIAAMLCDPRDWPFVRLCILLCCTTVPAAFLFFIPGLFSWPLGIAYILLNNVVFTGRYILMLHNVSHRSLFRKEFRYLNRFIPWILGPFFGVTPETYFAHHIGMHHVENNMDDDGSSTLKYRRDSLRGFILYYLRFLGTGIPDLYRYLSAHHRSKIRRRLLAGELSYLALTGVLVLVNWKAALIVFVIPGLLTRLLMMMGNWAQHAFIDPAAPGNSFLNSITCINSRYNRTCWNDGYHIGHHLRPNLHWTEMPGDFLRSAEEYRRRGSIVFRKADYFLIWIFLMTKSYGALARHFVELDPAHPKTKEEIITLLKSRTRWTESSNQHAGGSGQK
jgi:fatty acid desaturase